jgi:F-type H+-transporting ATPase subunit a
MIFVLLTATFIISILGGALGNAFGLGFLSSSLPAIQLPAEKILDLGDFALMNTMVTTWLAMIVLIAISLKLKMSLKEVPGRFQALFEIMIEFFLTLCESVAGKEKARKFFPLVFTIFIFIVIANWMGILPGFGTIGRVADPVEIAHHHGNHYYQDPAETADAHDSSSNEHAAEVADAHDSSSNEHEEEWKDDVKLHVFNANTNLAYLSPGSLKDQLSFSEYENRNGNVGDAKIAGHLVPFLRSANTDLNMTLAMAIVAMVMVHFWGFSILGFPSHIGKFINLKEGPIGFFVGILEIISELAKVVSFTFRLFGNIFAGEVLLMAMGFLLPLLGIIPFLGLELFVGVIQAFIFAMLTLVFASMATVSHGSNDHH